MIADTATVTLSLKSLIIHSWTRIPKYMYNVDCKTKMWRRNASDQRIQMVTFTFETGKPPSAICCLGNAVRIMVGCLRRKASFRNNCSFNQRVQNMCEASMASLYSFILYLHSIFAIRMVGELPNPLVGHRRRLGAPRNHEYLLLALVG